MRGCSFFDEVSELRLRRREWEMKGSIAASSKAGLAPISRAPKFL